MKLELLREEPLLYGPIKFLIKVNGITEMVLHDEAEAYQEYGNLLERYKNGYPILDSLASFDSDNIKK